MEEKDSKEKEAGAKARTTRGKASTKARARSSQPLIPKEKEKATLASQLEKEAMRRPKGKAKAPLSIESLLEVTPWQQH